ncbi:LacI family transcriptional regulator [Orenia metallireducens]|uniref:Transcriptional regulator, LacI family n=1 Tax=Orenia metallireducens TaxID=1413210 RepID=A0A285H341_9FIRM|nr:LacI family DNA-binding transcriptional regulator [Orenia metallireducens]PRX21812.1 LacI family transcriptional regulator [Orenia metallireducens]SNY29166.1 transcriptional regulator, LacI family [Orenia metallireducens]
MSITMKDIAAKLGVSESTVSRAINNKPGVGEDTKQKILNLARRYNYQPNLLARNLARQESNMIGLILPDISSLFYSEVTRAIQDIATKHGYQVMVCNTDSDEKRESAYIEWLQGNKIAGIIFLGNGLANNKIINLGLSGYPIVLANRLVEEVMLPSVIIDNNTGAFEATKHLLERGHKRIALINGPKDNLTAQNRFRGYREALKEYNLDYDPSLIINKDWSRECGYQGFLELLNLEEPPTAIFAANDLIAVGVIEAIKMGGYLIPEEIAVVGFEDTIVTSIIEPPLTTVAQPMYELGANSAKKLFSLIEDEDIEENIEILTSKLIVRKST